MNKQRNNTAEQGHSPAPLFVSSTPSPTRAGIQILKGTHWIRGAADAAAGGDQGTAPRRAPAAPGMQGCLAGCWQGLGPDTLSLLQPAAGCIPHRAALTLLFPSPDPEPLLDRQQWRCLPCACLRCPLRDSALLHVPPWSPPRSRWCLRVPRRLRPRQPRGTDSHGWPLWHSWDEPWPQWL